MAGRYSVETIFKAIDVMTGPINKMETKLGGFKKKLKSLSAVAIGLGTAISAALAGPVKLTMGFEAAMSKVGAVSRASGEDLAMMTAKARELGATTVWSSTQAAEGMLFLAMAGFKANEVVEAMPGMLDLASAGGLELASAADIASNILTGFGLKAKDMGRVADVMTNALTRSNVSVEMLGETMKYVAPVAADLGVSLEQTTAMTGKLGDAGIQASMAGTALRAIIGRLAAPPKAAQKALDKIGVSVKDAKGNMRDLPTILAEIHKKTEKMGNTVRAGILKDIAGEEAFSALSVLTKQAGTGELQKFVKELEESGSAARVAQQMNDNAAGAIKNLKSAMEEVSLTIGSVLTPYVKEYAERGAEVLKTVTDWAKANPELTATIVKITLGIGALIAIVGAMMLAFTLVSGPALLIAKAIWVIVGAVRMLTVALLTNPIILIITVIIGLAALIIANWDVIGPYFKKLWDGIGNVFSAAKDYIMGIIETIAGGVMAVVDKVAAAGRAVKNFFSGSSGDVNVNATPSATSIAGARSSNTTTTERSVVTIQDQTGRAKVTSGNLGNGLVLKTSGGF